MSPRAEMDSVRPPRMPAPLPFFTCFVASAMACRYWSLWFCIVLQYAWTDRPVPHPLSVAGISARATEKAMTVGYRLCLTRSISLAGLGTAGLTDECVSLRFDVGPATTRSPRARPALTPTESTWARCDSTGGLGSQMAQGCGHWPWKPPLRTPISREQSMTAVPRGGAHR